MTAIVTLTCVTLVGVAFYWLSHQPRVVVHRQTCYAEIDRPLVVYCPDGRAYWHDIGAMSPVPKVPK